MGLFSKKNPDQKKAYSVYAASGMGLNTGLAYILQMTEKGKECIQDYIKRNPEAGAKFEALSKQIGKKEKYKLDSSFISNPLSVISTPKPYDAVENAEKEIVKKTGLSLDTLKAAEGEHFFRHTYQYAPTKKDIEYKICVMYYFEP